MQHTQSTTRLVVSGHISPRCMSLDVDPAFGNADEWSAAMENVVDATPEEMEATEDYESYLDDVEWMRRGCW